MNEYIINLHIHTLYSDGSKNHAEIAKIALKTGLDVIITTDHNVWVKDPEGYYKDGNRRVLLLVGEEIHDQARDPQKNHLLVFGTNKELAPKADDTQRLIEGVNKVGGICFLAHPHDREAPVVGERSISWVDWNIQGYTGIELWNSSAEYKDLIKSIFHAVFYAYNPSLITRGPFSETLKKWDDLLAEGHHVVAIGGSDAHAELYKRGFLQCIIFPYEHLFRGVNTHILTKKPLEGDYAKDSQVVLNALQQGHAFIGYDLPASTRDFRFTAQGKKGSVLMGDEVACESGVTLQIRLPLRVECHLLKDGHVIKTWKNRDTCTLITTEPGVYRVEVYLPYKGCRRGWIYSNPIYVR
jgi:hypothetical protein